MDNNSTVGEAISELSKAIRSLGACEGPGPVALEALAMSIAGPGIKTSLCESIDGLASAIEGGCMEIAEAILKAADKDNE